MRHLARNLCFVFAAGTLGGLANSVALWAAGKTGLTTALGVKLAPAFKLMWLYPRIVWGGIWGALFLIPLLNRSPVKRGLLMSAGPTLVQLGYIFPKVANKGMLGLGLGTMTPLFVVLFNGIWGITAAYWLSVTGEE